MTPQDAINELIDEEVGVDGSIYDLMGFADRLIAHLDERGFAIVRNTKQPVAEGDGSAYWEEPNG